MAIFILWNSAKICPGSEMHTLEIWRKHLNRISHDKDKYTIFSSFAKSLQLSAKRGNNRKTCRVNC